jgi:hypothetical protein
MADAGETTAKSAKYAKAEPESATKTSGVRTAETMDEQTLVGQRENLLGDGHGFLPDGHVAEGRETR